MLTDFNSQKGFTLIELMIAITLGLLISAAALMIFLSSQRNLAMQAGMGEIQQNAIFGLTKLTYQLRHISLDTGAVDRTSPTSGIVFDTSQANGHAVATTRANANPTNMNVASDRLTIKYTMPTNTMRDCEGTDNLAGQVIVEQYYVQRLPDNQQPRPITEMLPNDPDWRYGLYCDSSANGIFTGSTGRRAVIIPDVEILKVSLATRNNNGTAVRRDDDIFRYWTLEQYMTTPPTDPVVAIEVGAIMRSSNSVQADNKINNTNFTIAGQPVELNANAGNNRYLRTPITQVVAIRNSQGY